MSFLITQKWIKLFNSLNNNYQANILPSIPHTCFLFFILNNYNLLSVLK